MLEITAVLIRRSGWFGESGSPQTSASAARWAIS
jgi:hypothetical protein